MTNCLDQVSGHGGYSRTGHFGFPILIRNRNWEATEGILISVKANVCWSIYVRAATIHKAKKKHLPPIESALDGREFEWAIFTEKDGDDSIRMVNYQNLHGTTTVDVIVPVLQRAYRLANDWQISGLADLGKENLRHVMGRWDSHKPSHRAPALVSVIFEIQPGQMVQEFDDGDPFWISSLDSLR